MEHPLPCDDRKGVLGLTNLGTCAEPVASAILRDVEGRSRLDLWDEELGRLPLMWIIRPSVDDYTRRS